MPTFKLTPESAPRTAEFATVPASAPLSLGGDVEVPLCAPLLELRNVSKSFPGVRALQGVGLTLSAGEVLAIVGENGAGKSTLIKILGGILQPDAGEILIGGRRRQFCGVREAMHAGIGVIHQELNLAPALSVAENVYLGRQPTRGPRWCPITNRKVLYHDAAVELERVGLAVSPREPLGRLDIARQQLVEIAKALAIRARILILDEPTSSLSIAEADRLLAILNALKRGGTAIIYVSHRLGEVERIADRVVVLRDGRHVGTLAKADATHDRMISLMVGRQLQNLAPRRAPSPAATAALEVRRLRRAGDGPEVSFRVNAGEIVGFAGVVGAGRTGLARTIFGIEKPAGGVILVNGGAVDISNPADAINAGLALVPEDRKAFGLIVNLSMAANVSLTILRRLGMAGWYNRGAERSLAKQYQADLNIRAPTCDSKVYELSGGNQQKVVLAKWLAAKAKVLILDEPTRGVDIGAKQEIYSLIHDLTNRGMAVMLISSEMEEIIAMSNRVLVMHRGGITGELSGKDITEENIMRLAVGNQVLQDRGIN